MCSVISPRVQPGSEESAYLTITPWKLGSLSPQGNGLTSPARQSQGQKQLWSHPPAPEMESISVLTPTTWTVRKKPPQLTRIPHFSCVRGRCVKKNVVCDTISLTWRDSYAHPQPEKSMASPAKHSLHSPSPCSVKKMRVS